MCVDDLGFDGVLDEDIAAALELARASTMLLIKVNAVNIRSPGGAVATRTITLTVGITIKSAMEKLIDNERPARPSRIALIVEDTYAEERGDVDDLALPPAGSSAKELASTGTKVVLVLSECRPHVDVPAPKDQTNIQMTYNHPVTSMHQTQGRNGAYYEILWDLGTGRSATVM
ncbi:hypothetical protein JG687_00012454 [Phytophthora cactorum]|uniref:Uncharacterized protein n=2 Tax=Phytophthora cactorum TaxID=29920 RepID=A0A8T1U6D4_9STRA|nr:hypothetical protein JG687_00012454 [Phytophthora cactorum]